MEKKESIIRYTLIAILIFIMYSCVTSNNANTTSNADLNASPVSLDAGATIDREFTSNEFALLVATTSHIKSKGNKCDSVSSARTSAWDGAYTVLCNNFKYEYEFKDVGGNIEYKVIR